SVAAFQAGIGSAFNVTVGDLDSDVTQKALGLFIQDNFKVRSNVTLELGFRYDLNMSPTEADNHFVYFDPATASLYQIGQGGPRDKFYDTANTFQPRGGIIGAPWNDGRPPTRAAWSLLSAQRVTNMVPPTAGNPPIVTPLTYTGAIKLESALA